MAPITRAAGLVLVGLIMSVGPVRAQGTETRQGFWFSAGAGLGSRGISCRDCIGSRRQEGLFILLRGGGTVSRQVTLGANLTGWIHHNEEPFGGRYAVFTALMGTAQVYPIERSGLHLIGGSGYIVDVVDDETVIEGVGLTLGAGFDLGVGSRVSVTPLINYLRMLDGALQSSLYQFGVAVTWH